MEEQVSPRNAIFRWLEHAGEDAVQPDCVDFEHSDKLQLSEKRKLPEKPSVATDLKLHTPFRQFQSRGQCERVDRGYRRKRKRDSLRESSSACSEKAQEDRVARDRSNGCFQLESSCSSGADRASSGENSEQPLKRQEPPKKSYERRRRHKTKEDRYVLKEKSHKNGKSKVQGAKAQEKKGRKQKHKEKTGAALLHGFNAANVASERLTLKPPSKVGLFTKGRASSPYRRRALPDLSFSELNFLNNHRQDPQKFQGRHERSRDRKKRLKDSDRNEEFSKFFGAKESPSKFIVHAKSASRYPRPGDSQHQERITGSADIHGSSTSQPSLPPIDLPGRPFLGFGKCAPRIDSQIRSSSGMQQDSNPLKARNQAIRPLPQSQISWSQSAVTPRSRSRRLRLNQEADGLSSERKPQLAGKTPTARRIQGPEDFDEATVRNSQITRPSATKKQPNIPTRQGRFSAAQSKLLSEGRQSENPIEDRQGSLSQLTAPATDSPLNNQAQTIEDLDIPLECGNVQQKGFMDELGKLLQRWTGKDIPEATVAKIGPADPDQPSPPSNLHERQIEDPLPEPEKGQVVEEIPNGDQKEDPLENPEKSLQGLQWPSSQPPVAESCLGNKHGLQKSAEERNLPDMEEQGSCRTDPPHQSEPGYPAGINQPLMPVPNLHLRHAGPSLFMSPESIYERQMQDQEFSPNATCFTKDLAQYPHSAAPFQRPVSRLIPQPPSRHLLRPSSRPFSARYEVGSRHSPNLTNESYIDPQRHYRTPSLSNLSSIVERANVHPGSAPLQRSRFFPTPQNQIQKPCQAWEDQPDVLLQDYSIQEATAHNIPWQQETHLEPSISSAFEIAADPNPLYQNHTTSPLTAPISVPTLGNLPSDPGLAGINDASASGNTHARYQEQISSEDFPIGFWTPNKLY